MAFQLVVLTGAKEFLSVTPSDGSDFTTDSVLCSSLWIGGAGDVTAVDESGNVILFKAVPIGPLYVRVKRVKSTGTTATNIVAFFA